MSPEATLTVFLPLMLTLIVSVAGVFLFRGTYYKSLAKRLDEFEDRDQRNYEESRRLRSENETLRRLVTGEVALEQLVELHRAHESSATNRQIELLRELNKLKEMYRDQR